MVGECPSRLHASTRPRSAGFSTFVNPSTGPSRSWLGAPTSRSTSSTTALARTTAPAVRRRPDPPPPSKGSRPPRPLPSPFPDVCRVWSRVADKFGHVRADRAHYSVPIEHAYRPVVLKLFHDRVEIAVQDRVIAVHERSFEEGDKVLDPLHVLPLLYCKHRAIPEATALQGWQLPAVFHALRQALRQETRKPDQEWVRVLLLLREHPMSAVAAAAEEALRLGSTLMRWSRCCYATSGALPSTPLSRS